MMEPPYWWWHGFGFMWMIFPLLFLIVMIFFLWRGGPGASWRGGWREDRRESAREILDRRYASGEITKEQYEEMKRTLER